MSARALAVVIALALGPPSAAAATAPSRAARIAAAEAAVAAEAQRLLDSGTASVSVSLIVGHEVVSSRAFGFANVHAQCPATPETFYNAASTFKPVTATAVMQLVEQGRVRLDEPVETYLPELKLRDDAGHPVRVHHLLDHTSALTPDMHMADLWGRGAPETLPAVAARLKVHAVPGERFEYNNAAYALAGLLVERVSGKSFEDCVADAILRPLGITARPVHPTPGMVERLALPYVPGEDGRPAPVAQKRIDVYPAGDAYLTAADMAHVLCAHLNDGRCGDATLLKPESVARMQRRGPGDYGLGWGLVPDGDGFLIGHGGGVPGYTAFVLGDPRTHVGVAAMANSGDLSRLARAALVELRGETWVPPERRPAAPVPEKVLAGYVGDYEVQPGVTIHIGLEHGELYAEDPGGRRLRLRAHSETTFMLLGVEGTLTFRSEGGEIVEVDLDPGGVAKRIR